MIQINTERCIGCGACQRLCPMGYLTVEDGTARIMERRRCISCGHCVGTCPKQAVSLIEAGWEPLTPENELEQLLITRRSIRHFKSEPPAKEVIQRALDVAEYAASGKNAHAHRWTVLYGMEQTEAVTQICLDFAARTGNGKELIKVKAAGTNLLTCDAPCVILAWSPDDALNPVLDPGLAMALVEVQLNQQGIGTCWGGYLRQIADANPELRAYIGIPEGCNLRCALICGYPKGEKYPNIPPRPKAGIAWKE